jgi:hypothetical protein
VSKYALCFLVIPLHSVFATGWNDYEVELGAGYKLLRTNSPTITISRKDGGCAVPPKIVGLNIRKDIILGKAESSPLADFASVPGFFILNTKTGSVQIGLDEQAWLNALRSMGFSEPPSLRRPSRFFMWSLFIPKFLKLSWLLLCVSVLLIACGKWRKARKRNGSLNAVKS